MLYLLGGFAILCGVLLLGYLFVNTEPARLARTLKWTGIVIAGLAVVGIVVTGRLNLLWMLLALGLPARLGDSGVRRNDFVKIARAFVARGGALVGNEPASEADVMGLLESAW